MRRSPLRGTVASAAGTGVLLVLALGGYYYLRSSTIADQLDVRNLRELDRIGRSVEQRVNNFQNIMEGLANAKKSGSPEQTLEDVLERVEVVPELNLECFGPGLPDVPSCETDTPSKNGGSADQQRTFLEVGPEVLHFLYQPATGPAKKVLPPEAVKVSWPLTELERILKSSFFDQVFLAYGNNDERVFLSADLSSGLRLDQVPRPDPVKGSENQTPSALDQRVSAVHKVSVAGSKYRLFRQPLAIELLPTDGLETQWIVGGVVSSARFRAETLAFDAPHLLFFGLLLVSCVLALPFLRIGLMGPRERLEVRDIFALGVSLLLASGLMGICLADMAYYWNLRETLDRQLEGVSQRLACNLEQEITDGLKELEIQSERFREGWAKAEGLEQKHRDEPNLKDIERYPHFVMVFWTDKEGEQKAKWTPKERNTRRVGVGHRPYHHKILKGEGWRPRADPKQSLQADDWEEQFFLESILSLTTGKHQAALSIPFCWLKTAPEPCPKEQRGAAVMIIRPLSLDQPVLPPGFEFALIDPDGTTQFHSQSERNLQENFFDGTDHPKALRSIVVARSGKAQPLSAKYMGQRSRLVVRPVKNTPYLLVVALDQSLPGTVNVEALFVAAVLFGIYTIVFLLTFAVIELLLRRRLAWAWPYVEQPDKHRLQFRIYLVFAASMVVQIALNDLHLSILLMPFQALGLSLVASARNDSGSMSRRQRWRQRGFLGSALVILATVALLLSHLELNWRYLLIQVVTVTLAVWLIPSSRIGEATPREKRKVEVYYTATALLFMVVTGLLPGYLILQGVFPDHLELLARYHQFEVKTALEKRPEQETLALAFEPFFDSSYPKPENDKSEGRCASKGGDSEAQRSASASSTSGTHRDWHHWMSAALPFVSEAGVRMRHLAEADKDRYGWSSASGTLQLPAAGKPITSKLPQKLRRPTWQFGLCLALGLPLLAWITIWMGRRVFLINLSHAPAVSLKSQLPNLPTPSREQGSILLFVCTRSTDRDRLRNDPDHVHYINLMAIPDDRALSVPLSAAGKAVCVDFLDHRFEQPARNDRLLTFVEKHAYTSDRALILLTSLEPEDLLARCAAAEQESEESKQRARRWTRALGRFVTIHVADAAADCSLEDRDEGATSAEQPYAQFRPSLLLKEECAGLRQLQAAAGQILRRPKCEDLPEDALIDQMREMAEGYYRALWTILRQEERLVLAQLAGGAVVSPKSAEAIRHLLARGLLVRDPELRLMNKSFARFVRETAPATEIAAWEYQGAASTWQQLRLPILLFLVAAIVFLLATQEDLMQMTTALVSSLALGIGALVRIFSLLQPRASQTSASQ